MKKKWWKKAPADSPGQRRPVGLLVERWVATEPRLHALGVRPDAAAELMLWFLRENVGDWLAIPVGIDGPAPRDQNAGWVVVAGRPFTAGPAHLLCKALGVEACEQSGERPATELAGAVLAWNNCAAAGRARMGALWSQVAAGSPGA